MKREFTATVYIIHEGKIFLHFHEKLQKWLPFGGHVEENETFEEAARREVFEETGLEINFIPQENIWLDEANATSLLRPYILLLERVPSYKTIPAHEHMDAIFIAEPQDLKKAFKGPFMRWITKDDLESFQVGFDILPDTRKMLEHIFESFVKVTL